VFLSEEEIKELSQNTKAHTSIEKSEKLSFSDIILEDEQLLIINKNPGLNVHPGDNKTTEVSLIQQVEDYYA